MTPRGPQIGIDYEGRIGANVRKLEEPARQWLEKTGAHLGLDAKHEISLLLCDRPFIRELNHKWRDKDEPTDVLSFPLHELKPGVIPGPGPVGDIVIAVSRARQDARLARIDFDHHFRHLLLHGLLHLLGHDHQTDREAELMETLESKLLETL